MTLLTSRVTLLQTCSPHLSSRHLQQIISPCFLQKKVDASRKEHLPTCATKTPPRLLPLSPPSGYSGQVTPRASCSLDPEPLLQPPSQGQISFFSSSVSFPGLFCGLFPFAFKYPHFSCLKKIKSGTSPCGPVAKVHAPPQRGLGSILSQATESRMPQLMIPHATMKIKGPMCPPKTSMVK